MSRNIKKIAVLTSGGDAPGMNAALRAVVRAGVYYGKEVIGVYRGYEGLIEGDMKAMDARSVANIINRGGTILKTTRSKGFLTADGRKQAFDNLKKNEVDALIVIGGDGTFRGATVFENEFNFPIIGLPGTIDNDLSGTDFTIGFDTACNTVIHAVDAIRDTASSHNRIFFIEVMGRDCGFIALRSGIAAGVELIVIPEHHTNMEELIKSLSKEGRNKRSSALVVVAEGGKFGNAADIAKQVKVAYPDYDTKVTVLGHIQRGGSPSCTDREIASRMGVAAVEGFLQNKSGVMAGIINSKIVYTPFSDIVNTPKPIDLDIFRINEILSV
jgi:6-phosphofructokinase 1